MLFLPISILCNGIIGTGIILSGVGIGDGNLKWAIWGISMIALGVVFTQLVRSWLAKKKKRIQIEELEEPQA
jgi:bacteriorhodopsin